MKIINIGMNHETAPVEMRECLATDPENTVRALALMRDLECIKEGLFVSTCNRVEALVATDAAKEAEKSVISLMAKLGNMPEESFSPNLYTNVDRDAVTHIFRVASSIDSMIVGEPQILGQIKEAYVEATRQKTSGVILNRLMHRAFHVAKRVRTETEICEAAVSISYAAIELAKKIFHVLEGKKVLLIGAGEMAELAAKHLMAQGVSSMVVANRTFERAVEVAGLFKAKPVSLDEIGDQFLNVDIVVTSTASKEYVITYDQVKHSLRKRRNRPLFFIDIAVPRDVEPKINGLENVYVYDIDDLKGIIEINMAQRQQEAVKAERIVQEEAGKFEKWLDTLAVVPTIVSLRDKADSIIEAELKKSFSALGDLTTVQKETVRTLTRSIAEKVMNDPIVYLKKKAGRESLNTYLDITRKLFNLDQNNGDQGV
ncbi:MAG: glutamyl-tRNA reductase [Deltaproteobacteria bacterium]|nr:glutamyl-tRNA reductase [Deltaproteobacteria bacterium]MBW2117179.1 glutamyl-tRNA reductase [Deltaproteobacteria bacterium]MBW2343664.1 glutamyl-tRNA reductase [Deltaproteobacteria bacterium]